MCHHDSITSLLTFISLSGKESGSSLILNHSNRVAPKCQKIKDENKFQLLCNKVLIQELIVWRSVMYPYRALVSEMTQLGCLQAEIITSRVDT